MKLREAANLLCIFALLSAKSLAQEDDELLSFVRGEESYNLFFPAASYISLGYDCVFRVSESGGDGPAEVVVLHRTATKSWIIVSRTRANRNGAFSMLQMRRKLSDAEVKEYIGKFEAVLQLPGESKSFESGDDIPVVLVESVQKGKTTFRIREYGGRAQLSPATNSIINFLYSDHSKE